MKLETIAVVARLDDGKVYQVLLNKEHIDYLKSELVDYFPDGKIKILGKPIEGIYIEDVLNTSEKTEQSEVNNT